MDRRSWWVGWVRDSLSCDAGRHPDGCGYRRYGRGPAVSGRPHAPPIPGGSTPTDSGWAHAPPVPRGPTPRQFRAAPRPTAPGNGHAPAAHRYPRGPAAPETATRRPHTGTATRPPRPVCAATRPPRPVGASATTGAQPRNGHPPHTGPVGAARHPARPRRHSHTPATPRRAPSVQPRACPTRYRPSCPTRYRPWSCPPPSHRALAMSIRGTWPSAERAASRSGVPSSR